MNSYLRYCLLGLLVFTSFTTMAERKKKIEFVGGARSIVDQSVIAAVDTIPDTSSLRKQTGGYALADIGLEIRPNNQTEIMGMFRIRNDFGGFWGAGVSFDVRQLWLKGVLGNVLKYQVGDINLKQTPFTLYNHHADRLDSMPEVFQLQNDIINYENFYSPDNTWRQQGVSLDFGLTFSKILREIDFNIYATRLRATDFVNTPERIMPGGSVDLWIRDNLSVGYNINATTDLPRTVEDPSDQFRNTVQSVDVHVSDDLGNLSLAFDAELGASKTRYIERFSEEELLGGFFHFNFSVEVPDYNLEAHVGMVSVTPEFRSVGAQSKDVNYAVRSSYYPYFTSARAARPTSLMDVMTNLDLYERSVSSQLMPTSAIYNNISPYGLATFNRYGLLLGMSYKPTYMQVDFQNRRLREFIGQGTTQLRQFNSLQLLTKLHIDEMTSMQKKLDLSFGLRNDRTWRDGNLEKIDLTSTWLSAGIDWEFFENIDFLGGIILQGTEGNEFVTERDEYTRPDFYKKEEYDMAQNAISMGLRYRFSEQIALSALFQNQSYEDQLEGMPDYGLSNMMLLFNMTF